MAGALMSTIIPIPMKCILPLLTTLLLALPLALPSAEVPKPESQARGLPAPLPAYRENITPSATAEYEKLAVHPELEFFKKSRAEMQRDQQHPKYHFLAPEGETGDPNGFCYWQGNWHLFYQYRASQLPGLQEGLAKRLKQSSTGKDVLWGHTVSPDLVHWSDLPVALWPKLGLQCFSGSALVEENRALVIFHETGVGNQIAEATDPLLLDWKRIGKNPEKEVTMPFAPKDASGQPLYRVWDPFLFKDGGQYFSVVGHFMNYTPHGLTMGPDLGEHLRRATWWLSSSSDLIHWKYEGRMLENDPFTELGDDGSCSYMWPLGEGKHLLSFFSHRIGSQLMVGRFDKGAKKFIPVAHHMLNCGPVSACPAPDKPGEVMVIGQHSGDRKGSGGGGWNGVFSIARRYGLGEFDQLTITPAGDTDSLRGEKASLEGLPLKLVPCKDHVLRSIDGNVMEILASIDPGTSSLIELNVLRSPNAAEYTSICLHRAGEIYNRHGGQRWTLSIDDSHSSSLAGVGHKPPKTTEFLRFNDEPLRLRVFLDVSIVEVFANDKAHLGLRTYPSLPKSTGVSIRSTGGGARLDSLTSYQMRGIWPELKPNKKR